MNKDFYKLFWASKIFHSKRQMDLSDLVEQCKEYDLMNSRFIQPEAKYYELIDYAINNQVLKYNLNGNLEVNYADD